MHDLNADFIRCARLIAEADGLLVTAGAGLGVDSGLPVFRGNEGMWQAYPAPRDFPSIPFCRAAAAGRNIV